MPRMPAIAGVGALGVLAVWSCSGDSGTGRAVVVRDSAGIEIVENGSGSWSEGSAWRIGTDPVLDIGVLEGEPAYQLFQVRDAKRLEDGAIVVANAGTGELRFYDSSGAHLRTVGRQGGGPGEFEQMAWIRVHAGDSLLVYDFNQARVSVFDHDGGFGRSFRLQPPGETGFIMAVDAFQDGSILARAPGTFVGGLADGYVRRDEDYHAYSANGAFVDTLGRFPGPEQFIRTGGDGERRFVSIMSLPFGRTSSAVAWADRFYFGSADVYEIACYEEGGRLVRLIRKAWTPTPVTADALERFLAQRLADAPNDEARRGIKETYAELPIPETMPAFSDLEVDAVGNLWVREFEPDPDAGRPWSVFDPTGRLLGSLRLPAGFGVTHIGEHFVLGVWRDDLDVDHVRLYELLKE